MIWSIIIAVVSAVFTYSKQQKMKKRMEAEADKRKGFEATVKGEPRSLPILYGRNKVGAVVTNAKTSSSFTSPGTQSSQAKKWAQSGAPGLQSSITFSKSKHRRNQFLTVQYAICQGGINAVKHIEVDEQNWFDTSLNFGQRIHTFNEGGQVDSLGSSNGMPTSNKFTDVAYATGVFHLDRDEPQYYGIPDMSFYVEGLKVPSITRTGTVGNYVYTYDRTSTKVYTTNPALILLDYLTADYGMGLAINELNIPSFYDASVLSASTVNPALGLGPIGKQGKVWGNGNYDYSSLPGNMGAFTRSGEGWISIFGIGNTDMAQVYSDFASGTDTLQFNAGGNAIYTIPQDVSGSVGTFNSVTGVMEIDIADVVVSSVAPGFTTSGEVSSEELSNVTIRQGYNVNELPLYECNVTLDPAAPLRDNVDEILLAMGNADLVWSEGKYKLQLEYPTTQAELVTKAENTLIITDDILRDEMIKITYPKSTERLNQCTVRYANEQEDFASATATWPPTSSAVHNTYLTQDHGVVLNASLSIGAITDPYHASARAEQFVRESRRAVIYEFECFAEAYNLEPGDYIKFNSTLNALTSSNDTALVTGVELTENMTVKIEAVRTNATDLAWNTEDEVTSPYPEITSFKTFPPTIANSAIAEASLATDSVTGYFIDEVKQRVFLRWNSDVFGDNVNKFSVEAREDAATDDNKWVTIGETYNETLYHVPGNPGNNQYYRVRAITTNGNRSAPSVVVGPVNVQTISLKESVIPIYADDASGTNASFTLGAQTFVNFYKWTTEEPTVVPSVDEDGNALVYVKFVGENGVSYTGTTEYYKLTNSSTAPLSSASGWLTTPQTPTSSNQYLWNYNENSKSDGTSTNSPVSLITQYVEDGRGINTITEEYQLSASATSAPTGTWSSTFAGAGAVTSASPYMWNKTTTSFTDGSSNQVIISLIAARGTDGVSYTGTTEYYKLTNSNTAPTTGPSGWSTTPQTPTSTNQYLWNYNENSKSNGTSTNSPVSLITQYVENGDDGKGIDTITEEYQLSASATSAPTGTWSSTFAGAGSVTPALPYMWNKTTILFTDTTTQVITTLIAARGTDGVSYTGTTEYYQLTNSSTAPTGFTGWSTTPQTPTSTNQYLWNFNRNTKSDGTFTNSPVSLITQYVEDGKGINTITEEYQLGTSPTSAPTGTWSSTFTGAGAITDLLPYMWNRTTTSFTDGSSNQVIITLIAARGEDGVSYTGTVEYYKLTNSNTAPLSSSSGWLTTPQTPTSSNQYLWNFNRNSKSDLTSTDSPVSLVTQYVEDGKGIDTITEEYQLGTSATSAPTGSWSSTFALAGAITDLLPYMWNKTTILFTDTTTQVVITLIAARGENGDAGGSVNVAFTRSNSTPQATGTGVLPTGSGVTWSDDAPTGTALLWAVNGNLDSGSTTWSWGTPYQVEGTAVAELYVFRRNATTFSNNGSYNFVSGVLTPPTGWSTIPLDLLADGDKVYVSLALVTGGPTDTSVTPSWNTPKVYAQRQDGEGNIVAILSNQNHTLSADSSGNVVSGGFLGSGTDLQLFEGTTPIRYANSGTTAGTFAVGAGGNGSVVASSGITRGSGTQVGSSANYFLRLADATAMTTDTGTITFNMVGKKLDGTAFTPFSIVQTLSKVRAGGPGGTGPDGLRTVHGYVYFEKSVSPSIAPSLSGTSTYNIAAGKLFGSSTFVGATGTLNAVDKWTNEPRTQDASSANTFWSARYYGTETTAGSSSITVNFSSVVEHTSFSGVVTFNSGTGAFEENGGSITTIDGGTIDTGTITADRLEIGDTNIGGTTSTLKLYSDCLKVFNNGVMRVKLGNLANLTDD